MRHAATTPGGRRRRRVKAVRPRSAGPQAPADGADHAAAGSGGSRRRLSEQLPYVIVLCGTGLSLLSMRLGEQDARSGTLELAGVLLVAAAARLTLPERRAGMLRSRGRLADVAALAALGIGMLVTALVFPVPA